MKSVKHLCEVILCDVSSCSEASFFFFFFVFFFFFFFCFVNGTLGSFYFYFLKFGKCEGSGKILVDLPS